VARDHTRVNIDIWGDDEFCELPVDSQALYWTLWTSAGRSYCGAHDWNPAKLAQRAGDWSVPRIESAAAVLSERLFLIIDTDTSECLLRSWIKHDGLWRIPNMAVTMANARAELASKTLRGVIVHEVRKLRESEPKLGSWDRPAVQKMLAQKAIDPSLLVPFDPGPNGGINPASNPSVNPSANPPSNPPAKGYDGGWANPPSNPPPNPPPTTATATDYSYKGGYLSEVRHLESALAPSPYCPKHPGGTELACRACGTAREAYEAEQDRRKADELEARRRLRANCKRCEGTNVIEIGPNRVIKCDHSPEPEQEAEHA